METPQTNRYDIFAQIQAQRGQDRNLTHEWLKVAILLGLSGYFAALILTGSLSNYINARFAWLSYVAAGLFFALGVASIVGIRQGFEHDKHTHEHPRVTWTVLAVVAVPLVLGTLIPSQPLGAQAIDANFNPDAGASVAVGSMATLDRDPIEYNVLDWVRAFNNSDDLRTFEGQQADVVAFVYHSDQYPDGFFLGARFIISCCVADATPIGLPVYDENSASLAGDSWVRVRGTFQITPFGGSEVPVLYAESIEPVEQPEHPYLYP